MFLTGCLEGAAGSADNSAQQVELPTAAVVTLTSQAEDAVLVGAVKATGWTGYTGTGFVDFLQASGPFIVADPATRKANLTWYGSYPAPGSEECLEFDGCSGSGYFAGVDGFGLRWVLYPERGRITETGGVCTPRRLMILKIGLS